VDKKVKIFLCPETKSWYYRFYTGRVYGINLQITNSRPDLASYGNRRKYNAVSWPDRTWLICDVVHYTPIEWTTHYSTIRTPEESGQPDLRGSKHHQKTLNFVFIDGHTENLYPGKRRDVCYTDKGTFGW
jgi:prepilin-type processing-associated H-X9-DG protein